MTCPLTEEQQIAVLSDIRSIVPDGVKNRADRRHSLMIGVIIGLQSVDHALVPPHWLMNVMAGRTDRLFVK